MTTSDLFDRACYAATRGNVSKFSRQLGIGSNSAFRYRNGAVMPGPLVRLLTWISENPTEWAGIVARFATTLTREDRHVQGAETLDEA